MKAPATGVRQRIACAFENNPYDPSSPLPLPDGNRYPFPPQPSAAPCETESMIEWSRSTKWHGRLARGERQPVVRQSTEMVAIPVALSRMRGEDAALTHSASRDPQTTSLCLSSRAPWHSPCGAQHMHTSQHSPVLFHWSVLPANTTDESPQVLQTSENGSCIQSNVDSFLISKGYESKCES